MNNEGMEQHVIHIREPGGSEKIGRFTGRLVEQTEGWNVYITDDDASWRTTGPRGEPRSRRSRKRAGGSPTSGSSMRRSARQSPRTFRREPGSQSTRRREP